MWKKGDGNLITCSSVVILVWVWPLSSAKMIFLARAVLSGMIWDMPALAKSCNTWMIPTGYLMWLQCLSVMIFTAISFNHVGVWGTTWAGVSHPVLFRFLAWASSVSSSCQSSSLSARLGPSTGDCSSCCQSLGLSPSEFSYVSLNKDMSLKIKSSGPVLWFRAQPQWVKNCGTAVIKSSNFRSWKENRLINLSVTWSVQ